MNKESKLESPIVIGRGIAPKDQGTHTIQDQIKLFKTWEKNCQAEPPKVKLRQKIDQLTVAGEDLGMNLSYFEYLSSQKE